MLNLLTQITNPALPDTYTSQSGVWFVSELVSKGIGLIFVVAAIIFVVMIIWGSIQWITSGGDKANVQNARSRITSAIIGLIILLSSYAIIKIIGFFFNIEALQNFSIGIEGLIIGN